MRIVKYILIFAIGALVGFYTTRFSYFTFEKTINLIDFATLVVTSTLGLYISITIQKQLNDDRAEKELLISEIKSIKRDLSVINNMVLSNTVEFDLTVKTFKLLSSSISTTIHEFECCEGYSTDNLKQIQTKILSLKQIITGSPTAAGNFMISAPHKAEYAKKYKAIVKLLFKEILLINRK